MDSLACKTNLNCTPSFTELLDLNVFQQHMFSLPSVFVLALLVLTVGNPNYVTFTVSNVFLPCQTEHVY